MDSVAVLLHALFLQTAWFGSYGIWNIATPFWTLTIEVLFYAVLPWIMPLFYRNRAFWLGVPCALALTVVWLVLCRWSLGPLVDFVVRHSQRPDASAVSRSGTGCHSRFRPRLSISRWGSRWRIWCFAAGSTYRMIVASRHPGPGRCTRCWESC